MTSCTQIFIRVLNLELSLTWHHELSSRTRKTIEQHHYNKCLRTRKQPYEEDAYLSMNPSRSLWSTLGLLSAIAKCMWV